MLVGVALVVAGIAVSSEVHRHHGVPIFVSAIACAAVVGGWALPVPLVLGTGYWIARGVDVGFFNSSPNGDSVGAERLLGVIVWTVAGTIAVLIGLALRALAARLAAVAHSPG
jgi:hypothetical protein